MKDYNKLMIKQMMGVVTVVCMVAAGLHYAADAYASNHPRKAVRVELVKRERANSQAMYDCTDEECAVIDSMFWEAMSVKGLRADFAKLYPKESHILSVWSDEYDYKHDCLGCRLKALASCYWDAEWSDCFDSDNGIAAEFEHVLDTNKSVRAEFNELLHACWGMESGLDD
jgi:hypothetical protein